VGFLVCRNTIDKTKANYRIKINERKDVKAQIKLHCVSKHGTRRITAFSKKNELDAYAARSGKLADEVWQREYVDQNDVHKAPRTADAAR